MLSATYTTVIISKISRINNNPMLRGYFKVLLLYTYVGGIMSFIIGAILGLGLGVVLGFCFGIDVERDRNKKK